MECNTRSAIPGYRRMKSRAEYDLVLQERFIKNKWFAVHIRENRAGVSRLGIIVSKRVNAKAVCRNLTKRLVREAFRQAPLTKCALDIVVRSRRPLNHVTRNEGREALAQLMSDISAKCVTC